MTNSSNAEIDLYFPDQRGPTESYSGVKSQPRLEPILAANAVLYHMGIERRKSVKK
jgi:hypothetical protein